MKYIKLIIRLFMIGLIGYFVYKSIDYLQPIYALGVVILFIGLGLLYALNFNVD